MSNVMVFLDFYLDPIASNLDPIIKYFSINYKDFFLHAKNFEYNFIFAVHVNPKSKNSNKDI